ncbi:hypothetical protein EXIGLDRAFT_613478, partial [Exidia glandulosa HHB12029]
TFNIAEKAMVRLTNDKAVNLGAVQATFTHLNKHRCGSKPMITRFRTSSSGTFATASATARKI